MTDVLAKINGRIIGQSSVTHEVYEFSQKNSLRNVCMCVSVCMFAVHGGFLVGFLLGVPRPSQSSRMQRQKCSRVRKIEYSIPISPLMCASSHIFLVSLILHVSLSLHFSPLEPSSTISLFKQVSETHFPGSMCVYQMATIFGP